MYRNMSPCFGQIAVLAIAGLLAGCVDDAPLSPGRQSELSPAFAKQGASDEARAIAALRRATARYHNVENAIDDGFILVHPCEDRPGEGPVGVLYAHLGRIADGIIDVDAPDGLIYEPSRNGRLKLVGVEVAVPYEDPIQDPPQFLGATLQPEDEFQVFGLHIWAWRHNPNGMLATSNPNVSCDAD